MKITRISEALGARVEGLDLSKPLDPGTVLEIKEAWKEHLVLVFPGQDLTPSQQVAFTTNFGQLVEHPVTATLPAPKKGPRAEHREIAVVSFRSPKDATQKAVTGVRKEASPVAMVQNGNRHVAEGGGAAAAGADDPRSSLRHHSDPYTWPRGWHTDITCMAVPPTLATLYGKQPLEMDGVDDDTCFCNTYAAYETLSPGLRRFLDGARAFHSARFLLAEGAKSEERLGMPHEQLHPCVRLHPETGRCALYVNDNFTDRFEGWTREESLPLLEQLVAHAGREENMYRHKWAKGDLVCWDERCTMHRPPPNQFFPKGAVRDLLRVTVTPDGHDRPRGKQEMGGAASRL